MKTVALSILGMIVLLAAVAWVIGYSRYRIRMADAESAWQGIEAQAPRTMALFDPQSLTDLPEIARRYLTHAIAPGTPLTPVVSLEMRGEFRLGSAANPRPMAMTARQILAAPSAFVWIPAMAGGGIRINGSDGLWRGQGWTRFWMFKAIPLVQTSGGSDVNRSAAARPALESVWAPAALHPDLGAQWHQISPDVARVTVGDDEHRVDIVMTLAPDGSVRDLVAQRWSNANDDAEYRLQPFGGTVLAEATFGGYTIPARIAVGNHYGTNDYFAFFEAHVTQARYLTTEAAR